MSIVKSILYLSGSIFVNEMSLVVLSLVIKFMRDVYLLRMLMKQFNKKHIKAKRIAAVNSFEDRFLYEKIAFLIKSSSGVSRTPNQKKVYPKKRIKFIQYIVYL